MYIFFIGSDEYYKIFTLYGQRKSQALRISLICTTTNNFNHYCEESNRGLSFKVSNHSL